MQPHISGETLPLHHHKSPEASEWWLSALTALTWIHADTLGVCNQQEHKENCRIGIFMLCFFFVLLRKRHKVMNLCFMGITSRYWVTQEMLLIWSRGIMDWIEQEVVVFFFFLWNPILLLKQVCLKCDPRVICGTWNDLVKNGEKSGQQNRKQLMTPSIFSFNKLTVWSPVHVFDL